ncbi:MAG: hypothetical protein DCC55_25430 [Chloroflexi bacterium]|nr:MAG: hypothetical protein DCC55_25430 [Chloroflexota bacterium]
MFCDDEKVDFVQRPPLSHSHAQTGSWSILICLLGPFRLVNAHHAELEYGGERVEMLLGYLALHHTAALPRDMLLTLLWPDSDPALAGQSLNSLVYGVRKALKEELGGAPPVIQNNGHYRLNCEVGVSVDIVQFEYFAQSGEQHARAGELHLADVCYHRAVEFYQGDLCVTPDPQTLIERERLRARYLTLLMRLADASYGAQRYAESLSYVQRLLLYDPCREDAHRLAMRCYVQMGERAQAFRQYRLCQELLRHEFDAIPEQATVVLFDQIRRDQTSAPS